MRFLPAALAVTSTLLLTACSTEPAETPDISPTNSNTPDKHSPETDRTEVSTLTPRVVLSHDEGLTTIDAVTGETIAEHEERGFFRLNQSGDGQHLMVTKGDEFEVFDTGNAAHPHGDHHHYYESDPLPTGLTYDLPTAGHVVSHDGTTALFSDGTGKVTLVDTNDIAAVDAPTREIDTGSAHHGVAVPFADGSVVHTVGTEEERNTLRHVSADGEVLAETDECPDIHGEAATNDAVVFGCTDGPVVFRDGEFHKIRSEGYQRNGNLAGTEDSPIVLGDNKTQEDAEFERPESVALIDSVDDSVHTVDLGSSYWFRSLARGPEGEALVLTYDGNLVVIDEESGEITDRIEAIAPWEENEEWQQPGPILKVSGSDAYITDPASEELVLVDLRAGEITARHDLEIAPVEMEISTGK